MSYVISGANLRAENYGIARVTDVVKIKEMLKTIIVPEFKCRSGVKIGQWNVASVY